MKNNMTEPPDFQTLVDQSIVEGVTGGIYKFLIHNRVNVYPTLKCTHPAAAFVSLILAEYGPDKKDFPFPESFSERLLVNVADEAENFVALFKNEEYDNLVKYIRVVSGGSIAQFLEDHREQALKIIRNLRED